MTEVLVNFLSRTTPQFLLCLFAILQFYLIFLSAQFLVLFDWRPRNLFEIVNQYFKLHTY